MRFKRCTLLLGLLATAQSSYGSWLDWIRDYDLNDYAFGVSVSISQNPYIGGENSTIAYPYLTSFTHSAFTKDWFLIRDGGYGARWVSSNEWELGVLARINTLGLGNSDAEELLGIADRNWAIEAGPTIGYRGWPVHIHWTTYFDVSDRHGGYLSQVAFSYPMQFERGFLVPEVAARYADSDYSNYYFSVSDSEATPTRPAYTPGASQSMRAQVRFGYELTDKWLLNLTVGAEFLGSTVTDSPITDDDPLWFTNVGVAYRANIFNPTDHPEYTPREPNFEFRFGAFHNKIDTKLSRDTADGVPGTEIDLEDLLGAPDEQTVFEADTIWRIGEHHRFEIGYFELARDSTVTLEDDLTIGDEVFVAGTEIRSRVDYLSLRAGYTFYLMRDAQKELGVMAGIHLTEFATDIVARGVGQVEKSRSNTPLPVIGVNGSLFLGEKTTLRARIHIFRTDFDQHEGTLNHAALSLEHRFREGFSMGLGYSFYGVSLSSKDSGLNGNLDIRHHGPVLFMSLGI